MPDEVEVATGYAPATVGSYLWQEFPLAQVERDLDAIAHARIRTVRVMLSWDAFMPTDRQVSPRRMRELESLLAAARARSMRVIPVLFVQTLGDCVMLPAWAVDARAPRQGVRVLTDGRLARGGPRDVWADPLMQEAEVRWLDAMLAAFAGHPAIAGWDLGHNPAATVRPQRIAQVTAWLELLAPRVRAHGEECRLTLGQDDLTTARAVRPHLVAAHVDRVSVAVRQQTLRLRGDVADPERVAFIAWLARRMCADVPLGVELTLPVAAVSDDAEIVDGAFIDSPATRRDMRATLQRLVETGVSGIASSSWCDVGDRPRSAPPCDTDAALGYAGIVDSTGVSKETTAAWHDLAAATPATQASAVVAPAVDVEDWYRNLPESLDETYASWRGGQREAGGIL